MNLEMTELASAYAMLEMELDERENYATEEEYFAIKYDVDLQKLADIFAGFVSDKLTLESAFLASKLMYELGRKHQQIIDDTPTI